MATATQFINEALAQVGKPYVYGGDGPNDFDCAGLVQFCLVQLGVPAPRTSEEQYAWTIPIPSPIPGSLIYEQWPGDGPAPGHVIIYYQDGQVIEAPETGQDVHVRPWSPTETQIIGYGLVPGLYYPRNDMYFTWDNKTYYVSGGKGSLLTKNALVAVENAAKAGGVFIISDVDAGLYNQYVLSQTKTAKLKNALRISKR